MSSVSIGFPRHLAMAAAEDIEKLGNDAPFALKCLWGYLSAALAAGPQEGGELVQVSENISQGGLQALLADLLEGVRTGDSLEGHVAWLLPGDENAPRQSFDVMAGWRTGNRQGQGGFRMIGRWERRRPSGVPSWLGSGREEPQ